MISALDSCPFILCGIIDVSHVSKITKIQTLKDLNFIAICTDMLYTTYKSFNSQWSP
jgi:hypothetical protein